MKMNFFEKSNSKFKGFFNKNLGKSQRHTGFTLAEVLITLVIIGVVAALTLPLLISKIDDIITRNLFLKQVALLEQASREYLADNGGSFLNQFNGRADVVTKFLAKYYKTNKVCSRTTDNACLNLTFLRLNSTDPTKAYSADTGIISADGTYIMIQGGNIDCELTGDVCVQGYFDINGSKGPNRIGYDTFYWYLKQDKVIFYHNYYALTDNANTSCIKEPNTNWDMWYNGGEGCAMRMLKGLPKWQ